MEYKPIFRNIKEFKALFWLYSNQSLTPQAQIEGISTALSH